MVAAAKISGSRRAAPATRLLLRPDGIRPVRAVRGASRSPGSQRIAASGSRPAAAAIAAAAAARWCPASQIPAGSATMAGTPADDAEQAKPLAAPFGGQQLGGERAGGHAAQAEAEAANQADAHHDGLGLAHDESQGRRAEQHRPGREHQPVAEPPDRRRGHGLGRHGAEQQGPGEQPGP